MTKKEEFFELLEGEKYLTFHRQGKKKFVKREIAFEPEMAAVWEIKTYQEGIDFLVSE